MKAGLVTFYHIHHYGALLQAAATERAVESLGGEVVKILFVMELAGLKGREKLKRYDVDSVICYEGK